MEPDDIERLCRDTRPQPARREPSRARPPDPQPARREPSRARPPEPAPILLLGLADAELEREMRRAIPGRPLVAARSRREAREAVLAGPAPALVLLDADAVGRAAAAALCRRLRLAEARAGSPRAHIELRLRDLSPRAVRAALAAGADEVRPPLPAAALAALLAAKAPPVPADDPDAADDVRIDPATGEALLAGRPLALTESEAAALRVLVAWNGRPRTRWQLLRDLRGDAAASAQLRAVDSLVADLRAKLGPAAWRLETAWGVGYRWNAAPDRAADLAAAAGRARHRLAAAGGGALLLALAFLLRPASDRPTAPTSGAPASNAPTADAPQVASSAAPAESGAHSAFSIQHSAFPPDPAVLALRAAFALPADTPPAVGIAVPPASDLLTSSVPPPDDFRL